MKRITTVVLIVLILLVGCSKVEKSVEPQKGNTSRFVEVELTSMWRVVADKETGVMYAVSFGTHNRGNLHCWSMPTAIR